MKKNSCVIYVVWCIGLFCPIQAQFPSFLNPFNNAAASQTRPRLERKNADDAFGNIPLLNSLNNHPIITSPSPPTFLQGNYANNPLLQNSFNGASVAPPFGGGGGVTPNFGSSSNFGGGAVNSPPSSFSNSPTVNDNFITIKPTI
jgi:hypothetical protein